MATSDAINTSAQSPPSLTDQRPAMPLPSQSDAPDNWKLELRFQDRVFKVVGRLPAEKREFQKNLPRKLGLHTRAKFHTIPARGIFCKFFSTSCHHVEKMKSYMEEYSCALCVHFVCTIFDCTLYLIRPSALDSLDCLKRLQRTGAKKSSIRSLCTDKDGVVIGFLVMEENAALVRKTEQHEDRMLELERAVGCKSERIGDALLRFDLLLDQLDTKSSSAIQICSKFIIQHQDQFAGALCDRLCSASEMLQSSKSKANLVFVAHDIVKNVRSNFPQSERNEKMKSTKAVIALEQVLFKLIDSLPDNVLRSEGVRMVFDYWEKWTLRYKCTSVPADSIQDAIKSDVGVKILDDDGDDQKELECGQVDSTDPTCITSSSEDSTSPIKVANKVSISPTIAAFMEKHNIQTGVWEAYLSRANESEIAEIDTAMQLNLKFYKLNSWEIGEVRGNQRRSGDLFLHHYVKKHLPSLINTARVHLDPQIQSHIPRAMKTSQQILQESFICTWDLDDIAVNAVLQADRVMVEELWKKMELKLCLKPSAFVFSTIRKIKTNSFAINPEIDSFEKNLNKADDLSAQQQCIDQASRLFQLDKLARETLVKMGSREDLQRVLKALCDRCRKRLVSNPSVHIIQLVGDIEAEQDPVKRYSVAMRSQLSRQLKLSALALKNVPQKRQKINTEIASASPETESTEVSIVNHVELTDAELAAVKKKIRKPPRLKFKKVDLTSVTYKESNENGTVGIAISGIPDAGRGLFNLSQHSWPAFSVVCIFGSRRISKDMHHDGLNKVARCGELGDTFVVVNGVVREVEKFQIRYGHRLIPFDGLVDAEGSVGGYPNDRVYQYPSDVYWDASSFYNNCILVPGCVIQPQDIISPICLDQLYIVTWKEVPVQEEFFLAYGTSYYEDDYDKRTKGRSIPR